MTGAVVGPGFVTLSGVRTLIHSSDPQGTQVYTIPPATFVLDHVGRLTGTYRVEREFIPKDGSSTIFWSQDERLDQVVIR